LIQGGFGFPWDGDLLIRGSPIFACKVFARDQLIHAARTETHILLKIGQWTIFCEIQKQCRFPRVDDAVPANDSIKSRVHFDAEDARFLETALDRLPGGEELNSPATIELTGKVTIRARQTEHSQITELILNGSSYSGPLVSISTNRSLLGRALRLGFREIGLASVESPIVCRHQDSIYAWQPLSADSAAEPAAEVVRIESSSTPCESVQETASSATPRRTMSEPVRRNGHAQNPPHESNGQAGNDSPGSNLSTLIHEAEALHTSLMEARASVAGLIAGLRRHRKQSKALRVSLAQDLP
jgi:hypothetical protein